jgi:hypothetical protein
MTTVTLIGVAACLTTMAGLRRRRCFGCAAEKAFQPADEAARFFRGLVARSAILKRLLRTRLEFPLVASWLARFKAAGFTGIARRPWFSITWITRLPRFVSAAFGSPFI